jgi:hypothetical protein
MILLLVPVGTVVLDGQVIVVTAGAQRLFGFAALCLSFTSVPLALAVRRAPPTGVVVLAYQALPHNVPVITVRAVVMLVDPGFIVSVCVGHRWPPFMFRLKHEGTSKDRLHDEHLIALRENNQNPLTDHQSGMIVNVTPRA